MQCELNTGLRFTKSVIDMTVFRSALQYSLQNIAEMLKVSDTGTLYDLKELTHPFGT